MLTQQALSDFKDFIDRMIAYAKVTINGSERKYAITRRERLSNGRVAVYIQITPQATSKVTVQKVQLYNINNQLWAEKTESIDLSTVRDGVLYRFVFDFTEKEE